MKQSLPTDHQGRAGSDRRCGATQGTVLAPCSPGKPWFRAHCPDLFRSGGPGTVSLGRFLPLWQRPGHGTRKAQAGFLVLLGILHRAGQRIRQCTFTANLLLRHTPRRRARCHCHSGQLKLQQTPPTSQCWLETIQALGRGSMAGVLQLRDTWGGSAPKPDGGLAILLLTVTILCFAAPGPSAVPWEGTGKPLRGSCGQWLAPSIF